MIGTVRSGFSEGTVEQIASRIGRAPEKCPARTLFMKDRRSGLRL